MSSPSSYMNPFSGDIETLPCKFNWIDWKLGASPTKAEGRMHWDDDAGTLELGMKGGNVNLQVGQELLVRVKNTSGATITNGSPVYINGADGSNPTVSLANATNHIVASSTIAVATEDILNNQFGYVNSFGLVRGIDTSFAIADGGPAFLSTTDGVLSPTLPTQPNSQVFVGVVLRKHATEGILFVKIIPQPNLDELSNVLISSAEHNDLLVYDSGSSTWNNVPGLVRVNGFDRHNIETMPDLAWSDSTRTLTLSVKGGSSDYKFWCNDRRFEKTSTDTITIDDTTGTYYVYYDNDGVLQYVDQDAIFADVFYEHAIVALIYWNATTSKGMAGVELHGKDMSSTTHHYNHATFGARYESGLDIQGLVSGNSTYTQTTSGYFWDEDIRHTIAVQSTHSFIYREGTNGDWVGTTPDNEVSYNAGGTYDVWNEWTGSTWQLTEGGVTSDFWINFYIATPDLAGKTIKKIIGQNSYSSVKNARAAIETEIDNISTAGLPSPEFVFLYATIVERDGTLQVDDDGNVNYDLRRSKGGAGGSSAAATSHGDLLGLGDDDHTQYSLVDGSRAFTGEVAGVTPTVDASLSTKKYVDDNAFSGDHADLTNVTTSQHHVRYSDAEAIAAVPTYFDRTGTTLSPYTLNDTLDMCSEEQTYTAPALTGTATLTLPADSTYYYISAEDFTYTVRIYGYNVIDGQKIFSPNYLESNSATDPNDGSYYTVNVSWDDNGYDGYRVLFNTDNYYMDSPTYTAYVDVVTNSIVFYDTNSIITGSTVTPTSLTSLVTPYPTITSGVLGCEGWDLKIKSPSDNIVFESSSVFEEDISCQAITAEGIVESTGAIGSDSSSGSRIGIESNVGVLQLGNGSSNWKFFGYDQFLFQKDSTNVLYFNKDTNGTYFAAWGKTATIGFYFETDDESRFAYPLVVGTTAKLANGKMFTSTGDSIIYNEEDAPDESLTNGSITGSASGWTLTSGWTYSSNHIQHTTGTTSLSQLSSNMAIPVEAGKVYTLSFDFVRTTGYISSVYCGGKSLGGMYGTGTYTKTFIATTDDGLILNPASTSNFTVDNFSLTEAGGDLSVGNTINAKRITASKLLISKEGRLKGYTGISATYTATIYNHIINCTANTFTITLPTAVGIEGQEFVIKNSGAGVITIDGNSSETIDGALTNVLSTQYDAVTIISNGTNWSIMNKI